MTAIMSLSPAKSNYKPLKGSKPSDSKSPFSSVSAGACWMKSCDWIPVAFESQMALTQFFLFTWLVGAQGGTKIYSLNGVPTSVALAVLSNNQAYYPLLFLFLAPTHVSHFWYYLGNFFGVAPSYNAGPILTPSQMAAGHVPYVGTGMTANDPGSSGFWLMSGTKGGFIEPGALPQITELASSG
jgi:hypothetical protein